MNTLTEPKSPRPTRRWLRRTVWIALATAGVLIAVVEYNFWVDQFTWLKAWREACAEADRLDPGWRWNDLLAALPNPPDGRNSAVHISAALGLMPSDLKVYNILRKQPSLDREYKNTLPQHRLSPAVADALRQVLAGAGPALAEARLIADCPEGRAAFTAGPAPLAGAPSWFDYSRVVFKLLSPQLDLETEAGDPDAALVTVRAMLYASHPPADGPGLLGALMARAIRGGATGGVERVLARGEPSPAALEAIKRLFQEEASRGLLLALFRSERAVVEDTIRAWDEGQLKRDDVARSDLFSEGRPWTGRPAVDEWINYITGDDVRRTSAVARLRHLNWIVECLKESPDGLLDRAAEWATLRDQLPRGMKTQMTSLSRYIPDISLHEAIFRSALVGLAAEQFRQAHGHWPASLKELVPQYLVAVPRDPFVVQPLRMARRPDGIVIYSVGLDGKDDGGDVMWNGSRGKDVGIRLWDVNQRRQPPVPPKTTTDGR